MTTLLNDGTHPNTGVQLLRPETVEGMGQFFSIKPLLTPSVAMFTDQIPEHSRHLNEWWESAKRDLSNEGPVITFDGDPTEGWGLSFSISHQRRGTGRAAGSASWEGLANLFWFVDRKSGVCGLIASQILPYGGEFMIICCNLGVLY